ncbi:MAG: hypothetical protein AUK44_07655 [Porphyromonadaceae bacterium CG2_30_38_12]|nr:MAG: hypothetical protein AUK44_07655 [Porphyromonadaceae bacterium CG2_30_38_12]
MKKNIFKIAGILLFITFVGGLYYIHLLSPIITGYAAKNLASGIFVAHRTQASLEAIDLNFSFIKFTSNMVDYGKKEVTSRFLWTSSKAIYIEGYGCTLLCDFDEKEIRARNYPIEPLPSSIADSLSWPAGDKLSDTIPRGINMQQLNEALQRSFTDIAGTKGTFAVAVAYKNQLVAEAYHSGFSAQNRFLSWSMGKSFTHALVGIMVKNGLINIHQPCHISAWKKDARASITLENLMHMNSGLQWNEDYGNLSDVTYMLHKYGDMGKYSYEKPLIYRPDSVWQYSSGTTNIVCSEMRNHFRSPADYYTFPRRMLFNPVGMRSVIFETDASGTFSGSSYLYASMRDYVRMGLLYLNNGNWLGNQILPTDWAAQAVKPAKGSNGQYGSFFWLNGAGDYPNAPKDLFMASGHDGQFIYIIPSLHLVVVRTGFSKKGSFDLQAFLQSITSCVTPD